MMKAVNPLLLRLKPNIRVQLLPGQGVLLQQEGLANALYGRLHERLIPLLNGDHSVEDVIRSLEAEFTADQVYLAMISLQAKGFLCGSIGELRKEEAAFWSELNVEPVETVSKISSSKVGVKFVCSDFDRSKMRQFKKALKQVGVEVSRQETSVNLMIVVCDHYLHPGLVSLNKEYHSKRQPWLLLRPRGREVWLGPYFSMKEQGCHECLRRLYARHRQIELFACTNEDALRCPSPPPSSAPGSYEIISQLTALEVARILSSASPVCSNKVVSLNLQDYTTSHHRLVVDPYCPVCGAKRNKGLTPVSLKNCKVEFRKDGGHRHISAVEMVDHYKDFVSPITGIVSELRVIKSALPSVHLVVAGDNSAQSLRSIDDLRRNLRTCSAGKGASQEQAKASALGEAIERFCGMDNAGILRERASYNKLESCYGNRVIMPNTVMNFSARQYAERHQWNKRAGRFNQVPDPLDPTVAIDWTPLWSLTRQTWCYVPTQLVTIGRSFTNEKSEPWIAIGCSNGNASGNTIEEAVLQGFLEVVERDSVAIWWYNRLIAPGVDLESMHDHWINQVISDYNSIGREVWALDLTADLGITCIAAVSRLVGTGDERIIFGLGCHLDPHIAVQRAVAEMNQMLVLAEESLGPSNDRIGDPETLKWLMTATISNQPHLQPDPVVPLRRFTDFIDHSAEDLHLGIQKCCEIVEGKGMEVLVLDQTLAMVGLPVVKVIVPGLRHFWARFGPGRLYEVPVALGLLQHRLREEELNPTPIFF